MNTVLETGLQWHRSNRVPEMDLWWNVTWYAGAAAESLLPPAGCLWLRHSSVWSAWALWTLLSKVDPCSSATWGPSRGSKKLNAACFQLQLTSSNTRLAQDPVWTELTHRGVNYFWVHSFYPTLRSVWLLINIHSQTRTGLFISGPWAPPPVSALSTWYCDIAPAVHDSDIL